MPAGPDYEVMYSVENNANLEGSSSGCSYFDTLDEALAYAKETAAQLGYVQVQDVSDRWFPHRSTGRLLYLAETTTPWPPAEHHCACCSKKKPALFRRMIPRQRRSEPFARVGRIYVIERQ